MRYLTSYFETTRSRIKAAEKKINEMEIQIIKEEKRSKFKLLLLSLFHVNI
jgi:hypothetical protein